MLIAIKIYKDGVTNVTEGQYLVIEKLQCLKHNSLKANRSYFFPNKRYFRTKNAFVHKKKSAFLVY